MLALKLLQIYRLARVSIADLMFFQAEHNGHIKTESSFVCYLRRNSVWSLSNNGSL